MSLASHCKLKYGNVLDSGECESSSLTHTMQLQSFVHMGATNMQQLVIMVLLSIDGYAYTAGSQLLSYLDWIYRLLCIFNTICWQ